MPRITRRQCGCNCSNRAGWTPQGDSMPSDMCSSCEYNPCEYLFDFGCFASCNGLRTSYHTAKTGQPELLSLAKDGCLFEDVCQWSFKESTVDVSGSVATLMLFRKIGFWGECTYPNLPPTAPSWYRFFKVIGSTIYDTLGKVIALPKFGCDRQNLWSPETGLPNLLNGISSPCGWYDLRGMTCSLAEEWVEFLNSANTFNRWAFNISGSTATLTGKDDDGNELVYMTTSWVCPDPEVEDNRNRLYMVDYPGALCPGKFPKSVCCYPAYTNLKTCCSSKAAMIACCDSGLPYGCLRIGLPDCGVPEQDITVYRYHPDCDDLDDFFGGGGPPAGPRPTFPAGITPPSTSCGYFWNTFAGCEGVTFGLMTYCVDGTWKARLYGTVDGDPWELIEEVTVTDIACCPSKSFSFGFGTVPEKYCCPSGITTDCCPDDPLPATLYATFDADLCAFDGEVVTLTFDGTSAWIGTLTATGCGDLTVRFGITGLDTGTPCIPQLQIRNADNEICLEQQSTSYDICPFASVEFIETDWNRTDCPCCDMGNTVTVTVTP